ncbi:conjugative transfer signal peptidase TraF [Ensifer adhaerens]|uniref:Conjugative transfer signal peptidase TraF n=1 Tax=Ensifer adhaerens TaxID=106592 RepID=A0A9Q8YGG1_ENSAD|nr:conjugative transfer signal peptidase TraF [Ensifer adhaerens]USJ28453.1 conjugative transfer signal peptidase TraF [Ensifer adhaerens]
MKMRVIEKAPERRPGTPLLPAIAAVTVALLCVVVIAGFGGYRINLTPSEPLGLWRIVKLDRAAGIGDLVFICPPQTAATQEARSRGYLRSGLCRGGVAPLIKTIIAVAGQRVAIGIGVSVDGYPVAHSALQHRDGEGRPMTPFGGGIVPAGSVFLHSAFGSSYDSRYFGPVPASGVLGLAQQVLTYGS